MRLPSLLRRTPFRLTLLFLALFAAAAAAILAYVYVASASEAQARAEADVRGELKTLTGVYALQIDEGGTFWIAVSNRPGDSSLWSFTLSTLGAPIHSGIFTDDPFYTTAVLIIPGEALTPLLAASGVEPAAGLLAAALLLVAGVVLVRRGRPATRAPQRP